MPFRAQQPENVLVYAEDFEDGLAQNWALDRSGAVPWSVISEENNRRLLAKGAARADYSQAQWGDGVFSFFIRPTQVVGGLRVRFRSSVRGEYWLDLRPVADPIEGVLLIEGRLYPFYDKFGPAGGDNYFTLLVERGIDYECRISIDAGIIKVAFDPAPSRRRPTGGLFPELTTTPVPQLIHHDQEPLPAGTIGFETIDNGTAWVDDLSIYGALAETTYFFDGEVFSEDELPVSGAMVGLFISARPAFPNARQADRVESDANGRFHLAMTLAPEAQVVSVRLAASLNFEPVEVIPGDGGKPVDAGWVEFAAPLWQHELHGMRFLVRRARPSPPPATVAVTEVVLAPTTVSPTLPPSDTPGETPAPVATTERPTPAPLPTDDDDSGASGLLPLLLVAGLMAALIGGVGGLLLWRLLRPPPAVEPPPPDGGPPDGGPPDRRPPEGQPVLPIPPLRLVRVWLSEGAGADTRPLNDHLSLENGTTYSINVQVPEIPGGAAAAPVGEMLNVVIYSLPEEIGMDRSPATVSAPPQAAGSILTRPFTPLRPGNSHLRVCVYYGNVLLQSGLVEANVGRPGGIRRTIDFVANSSLTGLRNLPQPSVNIFTNEASAGTHWIGVYAAGGDASSGPHLPGGALFSYGETELKERARELRDLFSLLQGPRPYRYSYSPPLTADLLARLEADLVRLASTGWKVFHSLFLARQQEVDFDRLPNAHRPGVVSVARLRGDGPSLPWAALYDLHLDTGGGETLRLCPVFKTQLQANMWDAAGNPAQITDLLDHPARCRQLAECPLGGPQRTHTVCPFGFWGVTHQIEQPIQAVNPTPLGKTPSELDRGDHAEAFGQSTFLRTVPTQLPGLTVGVYPGIPDVADHLRELTNLAAGRLALTSLDDRDRLLQKVEAGDQQFYYFYCHGVLRDNEFRLLLGPVVHPLYLSAADLDPRELHWPDGNHPLFVLNGCETMRITPELIHGFLGVLRRLGASGVVGSEMPVSTLLARPVGARLLTGLISGLSIGETFLQIRRELLRRGNPLGLAYTFYAPAGLHLHDAAGCRWCAAHLPPSS